MTHQPRSTTHPVTRMPDVRRSNAGPRAHTAPPGSTATTPAIPAATGTTSMAPHAGLRPGTAHPADSGARASGTDDGRPAWIAVAERALNLREPGRQALRNARLVSQLRVFALSTQADFIAGLIADHPDMDGTNPGPGKNNTAGADTDGVTVVSDGTLPSIPLVTLGSRAGRSDHNASYDRHIINAVLARIDGNQGRDGVLIIGATNYPDLLDPALVRPGRLGKTIRILPPQERELAAVFRYHLGSDLPQIDLGPVALAAAGASMADVMGMVQAARTTARKADRAITAANLTAAVGDRHPPVSDAMRLRIAIHEAGHIVAAHVMGSADPLSVTLTGAGGHADLRLLPHASDTRAVTASLICSLAGRAAEEEVLGMTSGGAGGGPGSDLAPPHARRSRRFSPSGAATG